ncbi:hypothetical protein F0562_018419 [Nyssa sinensis]|uniref:Retrotransposon gag domain-containing protein n=1 Tax=Nyssa sinensis TaxID=561372 RepID=A0A5J4ZDJ5_9ASTE|nr:hypothetical protein F0562_018419 [Nyssa sinensis]
MTLLNATLSQTALSYVIGYSTSREAWLALERRFSASTRSNILQLKFALHNISRGKDSIDPYIQKIKQARDSLASVSVLIEDEDILIYVLNGLPQEYNAFKNSIRTRSENITLEEVYAMLKIEEQTIESVHKQNHTSPFPGAMMASNYKPNFSSNRGYSPFNSSGRGRGRGRLNNRGGRMNSFGRFHSPNFGQSNPLFPPKQPQQSNQRSNNSQPVVCQICNKNGHSALDCYHRLDFSYQGKHPSPQLTAMSAAYNIGYDSSLTNPNYWYTDTGATNHITADLANLHSPIEYQGDDNITVANGQAFDISHSGCPLLEVLELYNFMGFRRVDVTSPSLRTLKLKDFWYSCDDDDGALLEILAPNLRSLEISGYLYKMKCRLVNVSSLVDANLSFDLDTPADSSDDYEECRYIVLELLESLRHVKQLTIGSWCTQATF